MQPAELHRRSIVKAISYRIINIITDYLVAFFFTKSVSISIGIVIIIDSLSTILYYLHERAWAHIHWGRRPFWNLPQ